MSTASLPCWRNAPERCASRKAWNGEGTPAVDKRVQLQVVAQLARRMQLKTLRRAVVRQAAPKRCLLVE